MNSVYSYTDYREYIRVFLIEKKKKNSGYSSRCAAEKCGVPSGTFTRILNGTRGIGPSVLPKIIDWLGLRNREATYFRLLVKFQQCSDSIEKEQLYTALIDFRKKMYNCLPEDKFHFFEQWYYVALYELVKIVPDIADAGQLGALLEPPVSPMKVEKALEVLVTAGFIRKTEIGYEAIGSFLSTGDRWESVAIQSFQKMMASLGTEALTRFSKKERDISTLSVSLSEDSFRMVAELICETREKIRAIESSEVSPEKVYQVNFQVFPLSRKPVQRS
ncbi:MAG TPA: TIGR02147 family protein [Chitinispirillaceae bacterium]|nr:TIGR02147 family protein [Chitinispirillaceae bacterium]